MNSTKCASCGADINPGEEFCRSCGYSLKDKNSRTGMAGYLMMILVMAIFGISFIMMMTMKSSEDYNSLVLKGNENMDNRMYQEAISYYSKALAIDSSDPNVLTDLGVCYHETGNPERAVNMFEKAIAIDPDHMITYFNLGIVYREMNQPDKVKYYWTKLIEKYPDTPMADSVKAYLNRL